jgi:hypothetical protein
MDPNVYITQLVLLFINVLVDIHGMVFLVFLEETNKIVLLELIGMETNVIILIHNQVFYKVHLQVQHILLEQQHQILNTLFVALAHIGNLLHLCVFQVLLHQIQIIP